MILLRNSFVALLYLITGKLSFLLFQQDMIVTVTLFIPEGIALAAVLIYGYRIIPGIFLGQFVLALYSGIPVVASFGISTVNAIEAVIAYRLFDYFTLDKRLFSLRDLMGLFLLIILILQPFSAFFGNTILLLDGLISKDQFLQDSFFWWFGNVMGQLLVTPMLLTLYFYEHKFKLLQYLGVVVSSVAINYILQISFGISNVSLLLIATLPVVIYLATINLFNAILATFTLVLSSLVFFHYGHSFMLEPYRVHQLFNINFFILSHIILVPVIGVLFREKERAIASLRSIAHYDPLTGLLNRNMLEDEIQRCVLLSKELNQTGMVCFIDIDNFKQVNDSYGHEIGDKLLQEVTRHIKRSIRLTDVLLRLGGDEFLLILHNVDKAITQNLLERMLESVQHISVIEKYKVEVSLSIGVACCPHDGNSVQELIQISDKAMYQVKQKGKNGIAFSSNCK